MTKRFLHQQGKQKHDGWHPNVPFLVEPKVNKTVKIIDGEQFYVSKDGRSFRKELFDKMFKRNY